MAEAEVGFKLDFWLDRARRAAVVTTDGEEIVEPLDDLRWERLARSGEWPIRD